MQFERLKRKRLGDILVDEGIVGKEHVIAAIQEQQRTKRLLSEILIDAGHLAEFDLAKAIVEEQQLPFIDLATYTIHKDLVAEFPAELLHRAAAVPLDRFGKQVAFACQELPSGEVAEQLRECVPEGCYFFVALAGEIRRVLKEFAPLASNAPPATPEGPADEEFNQDSAWKEIFDAANAAVLAELKAEARPEDD
jgi:hypothetical protein